jgi:hypothetical protein
VTVLRRKGNTLTAIIRLRKQTPQTAVVGFGLGDVYLLDTPRGPKPGVDVRATVVSIPALLSPRP